MFTKFEARYMYMYLEFLNIFLKYKVLQILLNDIVFVKGTLTTCLQEITVNLNFWLSLKGWITDHKKNTI